MERQYAIIPYIIEENSISPEPRKSWASLRKFPSLKGKVLISNHLNLICIM
jgi:hypothetical protein